MFQEFILLKLPIIQKVKEIFMGDFSFLIYFLKY